MKFLPTFFAKQASWFGLFLAFGLITLTLATSQIFAQTPNGVTVAGNVLSAGSLPNQLHFPFSVYLDGAGFMYVADYGNQRIQKFPPNSTSATSGSTVAGGQNGTGANQFQQPVSVFVDGAGFIYVADRDNNRIQKFPPNSTSATSGSTVAGGNGIGATATKFENPYCVFVDGAGFIYVADQNNHRIQKFPPNSTSTTSGSTVAGGNGQGSQANQFLYPSGVFVDGAGNIYVADQFNERVLKFPPNSTSVTNGSTVAGGNGRGSNANQFYKPSAVFVDGVGAVYVADQNNNRIQKFPLNSTSASSGTTIAGGNGIGPEANKLNRPVGLFVTTTELLYVAESDNHRVQRFGQFVTLASTTVCAGQSNTLTASVTGGNAPFSYSFSSGTTTIPASTSLASVTAAGPYSVTITDAFGVSVTATVTSTFNPIPTISISPSSAVVCTGTSVTLVASGASSYTWTSDSSTGSLLTAIPSATRAYTVTGTDASGCTATSQVSVTVNAQPQFASVVSTSVACFGGTGSFSVTTSSGTTPYTFSLNTGTTNQTGTFTGLLAGSYTISLSDARGCSATSTTTIAINQPASLPTVTLTPSLTTVCLGNSATVTASGAGGTSPYQYNFGSGSSVTSTSMVTPVSGNNLYSVTLTDTNSCTAISTTSVQGNINPTVTLLPASATLTCANPSVTLTASGGVSYTRTDGQTNSTGIFVVSAIGSYTVVTSASTGCTASATAIVVNNTVTPTATINPTSATLTCAQPSVTLTAGGGETYLWNDNSTNAFLAINSTGIYAVTVTAANGCTSTATSSVTAPAALTATVTQSPPGSVLCAGTVVTLTADIMGGTSPNTYTWSTGAVSNQSLSVTLVNGSFSSGLASLTVRDGAGCQISVNAPALTVGSAPTITTSLPANSTLSCTNTGISVTVTTSGASTFSVIGSGVLVTSETGFVANQPGVYVITATSSLAPFCEGSASITVTQNTAGSTPILTLTSNSSALCPGSNLTISANVTGSVTSYKWFRNGQLVGGGSANLPLNNIQPVQAGDYVLVVTGACGSASSTAFSLTVKPLPEVIISFPASATVQPNGSLPIIMVPLSNTLTYQVTGGINYERLIVLDQVNGYAIRQANNNTTGIFPIDRAGLFNVAITGANGCQRTVQGIIAMTSR